jgi:rhamnose utilization protein RhaD (predicted bifunctional aldolase and dehydrogenase)
MDELEKLKRLSASIGNDPLLVQAAGGNTSIKDGAVMWIKASGTWLGQAMQRDIFVPVALDRLLDGLRRNDSNAETCVAYIRSDLNALGLRPSIETTVHALMPQKIVIHVHCVNTIAYAIRRDAEVVLRDKLKAFRWAFIPYAHPGRTLAHVISARIKPDTNILILGNHGLVVAANTVDEAETLLRMVSATLQRNVRSTRSVDRAELQRHADNTYYRLASDDLTHAVATDPHILTMAGVGVFYPDHAVFLGRGIACNKSLSPPMLAIPGLGVLIKQDAKSAVEPMARCIADVFLRVQPDDPIQSIDEENIQRLIEWEAEIYRQNLKM